MSFVTVIIPTFNRLEYLRGAVDSVIRQTWKDFELIVVDDGSTDGTDKLLKWYRNDSRIRYVFQENRGPSAARNAGIREASHEVLAFLDSDDRFVPEKLEKQIAAMTAEPKYLISHTQEAWFRRGKFLNQKIKHRKDNGEIFSRCLELCAVGMSTAMVRSLLFERVGLFNENLPCCEDYDFWLRSSIDNEFLLVNLPLTIKNGGREDQLSWQYRVGMDKFRINAILMVLDSGKLDGAQKNLAIEECIKKCTIYGNGCLKHKRVEEGRKYLDLAENIA